MFEYIEEFISDKNPFFIEINMAATVNIIIIIFNFIYI